MNTRGMFAFVAAVVMLPVGCNSEDCKDVGIKCAATGAELQSCCSSNQCKYKVGNGKEFPCNGADCSAAAQQAVSYCGQ